MVLLFIIVFLVGCLCGMLVVFIRTSNKVRGAREHEQLVCAHHKKILDILKLTWKMIKIDKSAVQDESIRKVIKELAEDDNS